MNSNNPKTWHTKSGNIITRILSGRSNVFLLSNGNKNILIDTSTRRNRHKLDQSIQNIGIQNIDILILTHTHFDHASNAAYIKEKYKSLVMVHKTEASNLLSGTNTFLNGTVLATKILVKLFAKKYLSRLKYEPCKPDILADSFFDLKDFGFNAYVMHTPGHSCGSMSIIVDDEIALVGDTMFGVFGNSVFPPYASDTRQMIESWGKFLATGCYMFLPSHGNERSREQLLKNYVKRK
jgi:hydroxyacylglutathione hydrolase